MHRIDAGDMLKTPEAIFVRGHCTIGSQWSARMELISCSGSVWVRHEWGYLWEQRGPVDETMWVNLEGSDKRHLSRHSFV